jgi:hypothetical protein
MRRAMKRVTFYHSALCPRCHLSNLMLTRVLERYPDVEVTKVELLSHRAQARRDGESSIPTLVSEGRKLGGVILTPGRIERFLQSLNRPAGRVRG